jgi:hypothetical protein
MHTKFWSENLKGRDHSEDFGVDEKLNWNEVKGKVRVKLVPVPNKGEV